jgi:hypothetical protein
VKALSELLELFGELLESRRLDDDDDEEAGDESQLDNDLEREKKIFDEAIKAGFDMYPDISAIIGAADNLPLSLDPDTAADIREAAGQLRGVLTRCPIGATTKLKEEVPQLQIERAVKRELKRQAEKTPKYSEYIREDVPGTDVKEYGPQGRTSSKGSFYKSRVDYLHGGGFVTLFTNGWMRVCKDRIEPVAWSYQFGIPPKSNRQSWLQHYDIIGRNGKQSPFEIPREMLATNGTPAIQLLMKSGHLVVAGAAARKGLVRFLRFIPKHEIVRMPQVGFFEVTERGNGHYIYVRSNETLLPPALRGKHGLVTYRVDKAGDPDQYGHQIKGTTADWQNAIAIPLRGNSNIALALATSFASALIPFCDEQRGGVHIFGLTGSGKTLVMSAGESVYGLPGASQHPRSYGRTWGITPAGLEDLLRFRNHAGLFIDDLQRVPRASRGVVVQLIYGFTQVQKARGGAWRLRDDGAGQCFLLSSGEDPFAAFVGVAEDREGRERRVPAPGNGFRRGQTD